MFPTVSLNPKAKNKEMYLDMESIDPSSGSGQGGRQEGLTAGNPRPQGLPCQSLLPLVDEGNFPSAELSARCRTFAGAIFWFILFCFYFSSVYYMLFLSG